MSAESPQRIAGSLELGDRLDRWVRIEPDNGITVFTGKVELGQGIHSALALIVADELDVPIERVRVATVDTATSPDEGVTSASRSIEDSGGAVRQAAAEIRAALLQRAAARLQMPVGELRVASGIVTAPTGAPVAYADLVDDRFRRLVATGVPAPKRLQDRSLIGSPGPRGNLRAKVMGRPTYVHDLELPGMVHGRVLRPPDYGATLRGFDADAVRSMPGVVATVRDGSFVAVVAEREAQAIAALDRARAATDWLEGPAIRSMADPLELMRDQAHSVLVQERTSPQPAAGIWRSHEAVFARRYLAHAAVSPSCAVARLDAEGYVIWCHSQGIFRLRREIAKVLGCAEDAVRVVHMEGAGCYGHNGADDVALDAALLARVMPGVPVRVQWMRDDEFAWEPFGPAMVVRLSADLDATGNVVAWRHDVFGNGHDTRPSELFGPSEASLLAARHLERPFAAPRAKQNGGQRNAAPLYEFGTQRIVDHHIPDSPVRVSSLRSLGAHANVFAIESFMDELAGIARVDPVEFRLRYLSDPRAREVMTAAAELAGWRPGEQGDGRIGRGFGFARYKNSGAYAALVVEVDVVDEARLRRVWAAVDAGMVVSRDGLLNQVEGGIVQAASWTLMEEVTATGARISSRGWDSYRTLRFSEAPLVEIEIIDRPQEPPIGVGEAFAGPTAAAIANSIDNAIGLRARSMPLTREHLIAAMT